MRKERLDYVGGQLALDHWGDNPNDTQQIQQLQPLFVEFGNWILNNWAPMWVVNLWVNKKTGEELTTEELFLLWLESKQTKK